MANTYTQLHIQFIFAVKYRAALIEKAWKDELHKYFSGIFQENKHKLLQINSMPDHIHILGGMRPTQSISSLVENIKQKAANGLRIKNLQSNVFLAGRIRSFLLFKKPCFWCYSLHTKSRDAS